MLASPPKVRLTPREVEVVQLIAKGRQYPEIAEELHIELTTVKTHILNIKTRFEARNLQQVIAISVSRGLISV